KLAALSLVRADQADHQRNGDAELLPRHQDSAGNVVTARDAAEYVDQDRADVILAEDDPKRAQHLFGVGASAHVQEIGGACAEVLDQVHGGHGKARAVDYAADGAVQAHVGKPVGPGFKLIRSILLGAAHHLQLGMLVQRAVIENDLRVRG